MVLFNPVVGLQNSTDLWKDIICEDFVLEEKSWNQIHINSFSKTTWQSIKLTIESKKLIFLPTLFWFLKSLQVQIGKNSPSKFFLDYKHS